MSSALTRPLDQKMNVSPAGMFLEGIGCPISLESIRRRARIRRRDPTMSICRLFPRIPRTLLLNQRVRAPDSLVETTRRAFSSLRALECPPELVCGGYVFSWSFHPKTCPPNTADITNSLPFWGRNSEISGVPSIQALLSMACRNLPRPKRYHDAQPRPSRYFGSRIPLSRRVLWSTSAVLRRSLFLKRT